MNSHRGPEATPAPFSFSIRFRGAIPAVIGLLAAVASAFAAESADRPASGFRTRPLAVPAAGKPGFTRLLPAATGITFSNKLSDLAIARNRLLEIGSGVALGDVDGDGRTDVYLCGLERDNALYRNLGDWRFEDITAASGVACEGQFSTGAVLVDLDGDTDLDLLVNSLGGGTRFFRNDGRAQFQEVADSGLLRRFGATSMALADLEGDGDLDLYVTNYRTDTFFDHPQGLRMEMRTQPDGSRAVEPRERFITLLTQDGTPFVLERGEPDILYVNQGGGKFLPVPWHVGSFVDEDGRALRDPPSDWGLAVTFRDLNGDGTPDLYVCNDFVAWPDRFWLNEGGRRFRAAPREALRSVSLSSMAVDVADINRDGHEDLFVADMLSPDRAHRAFQRPDLLQGKVRWPREDPAFRPEVPRNTLQLARGDGTFAEIACLAGVAATDWTPSAAFLDVDLDGWEDLLIGAGNLHDVQDADALAAIGTELSASTPEARLRNLKRLPHRRIASMAFRNRHDLTFVETTSAWGFDDVGVAHGFAFGDLDNDGDLDVVVNTLEEPARVYRNETTAGRLAVRLRGLGENSRGVGARIRVSGGPVVQSQEIMAGGRFGSSDDPLRVFATGDARRLTVEVTWRSGERSLLEAIPPNQLLEVFEPTDPTPAVPVAPATAGMKGVPAGGWPVFEDVSARLGHLHADAPFDDFSRQALLPRTLSNLGPVVAWADYDQDGDEDLLVAAGRTGHTGVFLNLGDGRFQPADDSQGLAAGSGDQSGLLLWPDEGQPPRLIVAESNWEGSPDDRPLFRVVTLGGSATPNSPAPSVPRAPATGPLAMADIDGDGDLDLFVGGRAEAGRYPVAVSSYLYRNDGGAWREHHVFNELGMVSGAQFLDWDGDGDSDLALACDWGPPRLLRKDPQGWTDATEGLGLARFTGWWNGVAAGDFDGDGRMDLVLSNWGRNTRTEAIPDAPTPVVMVYGDFTGEGLIQTLLASADPKLGRITPWRDRRAVGEAIPSVLARFPTHRAYGLADVSEVLGDRRTDALRWEATTLESMVFLNRGDQVEARPLPTAAQFSTAHGLGVADFNGDGTLDVFLAQNFFGVDAETSRQDAGVGLLLLGDGNGGFQALPPNQAGCFIAGEGRGVAVADFDHDGRPDLAVGVNRGQTRLLRNRAAAPGLRIRVRGTPGNPCAVGAVVRVRFAGQWGPARAVSLGGGFGSQDASTLIIGAPSEPERVQVRWPGRSGTAQDWAWPRGARSVTVSAEGPRAD